MKYATASAFRTALETRLNAQSRQTGLSLQRLRRIVAFDRLLARLLIVAGDRWMLKGALALEFRLGARFRATKDMDLGRHDEPEAAAADFALVETLDLGDYFNFFITQTNRLENLRDGTAVRYQVRAELAGRLFENLTTDIGFSFGAPILIDPEPVIGPDVLNFAGIAPITIPTLPLEYHIAEKVHAYTRIYGDGLRSTRVKDLIDLVFIQAHLSCPAASLRTALRTTFDSRSLQLLPKALPPPPPDWTRPYQRMAEESHLDPSVEVAYRLVTLFLDPILDGTTPDVTCWDSTRGTWL